MGVAADSAAYFPMDSSVLPMLTNRFQTNHGGRRQVSDGADADKRIGLATSLQTVKLVLARFGGFLINVLKQTFSMPKAG